MIFFISPEYLMKYEMKHLFYIYPDCRHVYVCKINCVALQKVNLCYKNLYKEILIPGWVHDAGSTKSCTTRRIEFRTVFN